MMALQSRWPTQLSSTTEKSWGAWRVSLTKRKNTTRSFTAECSCFDSTILSPFVCRTRATITWEREIVSLGHLCSTMLKTKGVGKGRVFVPQSTLTTLLHREFVLRVILHWWLALICKWKQGALNFIAEVHWRGGSQLSSIKDNTYYTNVLNFRRASANECQNNWALLLPVEFLSCFVSLLNI